MKTPLSNRNEDTREFNPPDSSPEKRTNWYLVTGLVLGFIIGVVFAWWIRPVVYYDIQPNMLNERNKDIYRTTIALVYAETGDLNRASQRLALLDDQNPGMVLGNQAQRYLAEGQEVKAQALALLAAALQQNDMVPDETEILASPEPTATIERVPTQTLPIHPENP